MSLESEQTGKSVNDAINDGAVTWPATVGGLRVVDEVEGFGEDPMGLVVNSARDESDPCCIVDTRTHSAKTKTIIIAFDKAFEKGICMIVRAHGGSGVFVTFRSVDIYHSPKTAEDRRQAADKS